jgi:hypothetical protein
MSGSAAAGEIVQTPLPSQPAPETLNAIVSSPAAVFASLIAWRSDPAPESAVVVTVNVVPSQHAASTNSSDPARSASLIIRACRDEFRRVGSLEATV